jgi:dihydroneopterin aldolase
MTDHVFVNGLALHAYHGVMQHEAKVGQTFRLDLVLDIDLKQASRSDKLADTVGYDQVVDVASQTFCGKRYRLVEAAAGAVADAVLGRFPQVSAVRVTVHKPHAPIAATFEDVGVSILRKRQSRDNG